MPLRTAVPIDDDGRFFGFTTFFSDGIPGVLSIAVYDIESGSWSVIVPSAKDERQRQEQISLQRLQAGAGMQKILVGTTLSAIGVLCDQSGNLGVNLAGEALGSLGGAVLDAPSPDDFIKLWTTRNRSYTPNWQIPSTADEVASELVLSGYSEVFDVDPTRRRFD